VKLLFITRKYPPSVGGMEMLSYQVAREFARRADATVIAWGGSRKALPAFLPYAFLKALYLARRGTVDHIHLGDALLAPLGLALKLLTRRRTTATACGLDVTWNPAPYQAVVPRCLARLDRIICISDATMEECVRRGVPRRKCVVIPIGVHSEDFASDASRDTLSDLVGRDVRGKTVLVTVGRLVRRKGVSWFLENVVPRLGEDIVYLVAGDGPERAEITGLVESLGLRDRVLLLGRVPDRDLRVIYNTADVFVMPNRPVPGDMEGFGIVAIEASSAGLPVVAADLEGIRAAVVEGATGSLVPPESPEDFAAAIRRWSGVSAAERERIRRTTAERYDWDVIGERYMEEIAAVHPPAAGVV
jgi:glycosyltransferase involved in cell wall biosynthesis